MLEICMLLEVVKNLAEHVQRRFGPLRPWERGRREGKIAVKSLKSRKVRCCTQLPLCCFPFASAKINNMGVFIKYCAAISLVVKDEG